MRTTLRFTSVVAGVAALILLAAIILSANDWLSTSPTIKRQIAVEPSLSAPQVGAPAPQPGAGSGPEMAPPATVSTPRPTPVIQAAVGQASAGRAAVAIAQVDQEHADQPAADRRNDRGHDRHTGGRGGGGRER